MSHRSVSAMHRFCVIAITVFLLTACANQVTPAPLALDGAVTQTAPAAQANQPLPVTATSTPEPTPTSTSAPTATAPPPSPNPTATFTPAPPEPPAVAAATPPEVTPGVEFAIERKTIEAPDGSSLEVVGWGTEDGLMIYFQKEFADKAYTFGWGDSMKEAGAILMPSPNVSRVELKRRFRRLHDGVVLAKLGKIDTSKPIPLADLEEGEKYLAMHPGDTYEVSYGSKVGKVRADLPIEVVFVEPKYSAINSMDADFGDKEAKGMAPFTSGERLVLLDSGRGQDRVNEKGRMVVFFEAWSGAKPDILMSSAGHWQLRILTVLGCEAGGAFDFKGFRGQESDVDTAAAFRGTVPPNSSFWRPGGDLYLEDGRPPKNPVLGWSRPAD